MGEQNGRRFRNWGGTLDFRPASIQYPRTSTEVAELVQQAAKAGKKLRVVGTGHSWTRLVETPDVLLSLEELQGVSEIDTERHTALVLGGSKLQYLGEELRKHNLALENMGDIDKQSIAGTISTGTHGTGVNFGVIATQVIELWLVNGKGEEVHLTPADGLAFRAAQVALGSLGIVTKLRLQCVPAYNLRCEKRREQLETTLAKVDEYRMVHRNYEFFWFPYSDLVLNKFLNVTDQTPKHQPLKKYLTDVVYENGTFKLLSETVRLMPKLSKGASKLAASGMAEGKEVLPSHKIYPTERLVRFYEMEYGVPAAQGPELIRQIRDRVRQKNIRVHFPIEYRYVKGDNIPLSPAYGQEMCFISVHMYKGMDYRPYFQALEPLFMEHGGRPHWGKMHTQTAYYLQRQYPEWEGFLATREAFDPQGIFLNDYLREIFGM